MSLNGNLTVPDNGFIYSNTSHGTINIGKEQQVININGIPNFSNTLEKISVNNLKAIRIEGINDIINIGPQYNKPNVINIGNDNSVVNIKGTTTYTFTNIVNQTIQSAILILNTDISNNPYGINAGIQINSISGPGYIKTNNYTDNTQFLIKAPSATSPNYIATTDLNNNMTVLGTLRVGGITDVESSINNKANTTTLDNYYTKSQINNMQLLNTLTGMSIFATITNQSNITSLNVLNTSNLLGNVTAYSRLNVLGKTTINDSLTVTGPIISNSIVSLSSFSVIGKSIFNSAVTMNSSLNVDGLITNTIKLAGPVTMQSTLLVQGNTTLNSNLNVNGNSRIEGNLELLGTLIGLESLEINGPLSTNNLLVNGPINGVSTLNVIDNIYTNKNLIVNNSITALNNLSVLNSIHSRNITTNNITTSNNIIIGGLLNVSGKINTPDLITSGNITTGAITASSNINVGNNMNIGGSINVNNNMNIGGIINANNNMNVDGIMTVNNNMNVGGNINANNNMTIGGNLNISGNITTNSSINISDNIKIGGNISVSNNMYVAGNVTMNSNMYVKTLGVGGINNIEDVINTKIDSTALNPYLTKSAATATYMPISSASALNINGYDLTKINFNILSQDTTLRYDQWINGVIGLAQTDEFTITLPSAFDVINNGFNNMAPFGFCFHTYLNYQLGTGRYDININTNNNITSVTTIYDGYGFTNPITDRCIIPIDIAYAPLYKTYNTHFITRIDNSTSMTIFKL